MMLIHMLVATKFHDVTSQKAAVTVIGPTSLLLLHLCTAEIAEDLTLALHLCPYTFTLINAN
jgi:hypothetical protein